MNYLYIVEFDIGKPYKVYYNSEEDLKKGLKDFYLNADKENYFNALVYNNLNEDITESQFITEIIGEIINNEENF